MNKWFLRLIIGKTKKRYISRITLREGNLMNPPKYDIKSGRSHTKISSLYVDKGFKYKKINEKEKKKREKKIRKICKLIDKGYTNSEIVQILELPKNEICLPNDIRKFRIFKYISCDYEFSK